MSLESVFAALAGYLVLQQTLTGRAIIGSFLIFSGVLIVQLVPMLSRKQTLEETGAQMASLPQ